MTHDFEHRVAFHRALIPSAVRATYGEPAWGLNDRRNLYVYVDTPQPCIFLGAPTEPSVEQNLGQHEFGHFLHYKSKKIVKGVTDPVFMKLMERLRPKVTVQSTDFVRTAHNWSVNLSRSLENEQFGCFFDLVGALTLGKVGGGHSQEYYNEGNNAAMEVFAHGYCASVCGNPYIDRWPALCQ